MIRNFHFLNASINIRSLSTRTHEIPTALESVQFVGQLTLQDYPSLTSQFNDLLTPASREEHIEKKIQFKAKIQSSGIDQQKQRTLSSLITHIEQLHLFLCFQSDQQFLESMEELDNDRNLIRLRLEQIQISKHIRKGKQLENGIPCIVTSLFLVSQQKNNELAEIFTHTLEHHLMDLGVNVIQKESLECTEQAQTFLVIPAKKHFSLTYLENRVPVEKHLKKTSQNPCLIPLWLNLSEGNTQIVLTVPEKEETIIACKEKSYPQLLQEIFRRCHRSASIDPGIKKHFFSECLSDRMIYQSCTPRLDELTTDLHFESPEPNYETHSWDFIKRFPQVRLSIPLIHPELFKTSQKHDPSLALEQELTLTQFYEKMIAKILNYDAKANYERKSILGRLALYATFSNTRRIKKCELEEILTPEEINSLALFCRWGEIAHFSRNQEEFSFKYLIFQEYFSAHAIAQIYIDADKEPERFTSTCRVFDKLIPNPQYEFLLRFIAGHLTHQENPLKQFFLKLSIFIKDKTYLKQLLADCLIECNHPIYLSHYYKTISEIPSVDGIVTSWLLADSKELLSKEPKLWLALLSIHAKTIIEKSNTQFFKPYSYSYLDRPVEWPQEKLIVILESLASSYPEIMIPLLEKTLSSHTCITDLRVAIVKAISRLSHPHISDRIAQTIYHDPSDRVKIAAVEALAFISAKYPDRGFHLLQQLALTSGNSEWIRSTALNGLGRLHSSLYQQIFLTIKQILLHDSSNAMKIDAITLLDLNNQATKEEAIAILETIIANEDTDKKLKQAALLKIYPEMTNNARAFSILQDLCTLRESLDISQENFIFDELNNYAKSEPQIVMDALKEIFSHANNSGTIMRAANSLALLAKDFPHEILALYRQLRSDMTLSSFNKGYAYSLLLKIGENLPELVFPLLIESACQDDKPSWYVIKGIGLLGHINPKEAFETLEMILEKNQDTYVINSLGELGIHHPVKAIQLLIPLLAQEDVDVSIATSHALSLINNVHPQIVQSHLDLYPILKERAAIYLKELATGLSRASPDPAESMFVWWLGSKIADFLILNPSITSELFAEIGQFLPGKQKELIFEKNWTKSALSLLLQEINSSNSPLAHSLLLAIGKGNAELQDELKKMIASRHIGFSTNPDCLKIKISNTLLDHSELKKRMEILKHKSSFRE